MQARSRTDAAAVPVEACIAAEALLEMQLAMRKLRWQACGTDEAAAPGMNKSSVEEILALRIEVGHPAILAPQVHCQACGIDAAAVPQEVCIAVVAVLASD